MRILVIGGNGFIGSPLVRELRDSGHEVAVFHRRGDAGLGDVEQIEGDRNRLVEYRNRLSRFAPEVIVDLILSSGEQARELMRTVCDVAARVVAISSMDVYRAWGVLHGVEPGPLEPLPLTEDCPLRTTRQLYPSETVDDVELRLLGNGWSSRSLARIYRAIAALREVARGKPPMGIRILVPKKGLSAEVLLFFAVLMVKRIPLKRKRKESSKTPILSFCIDTVKSDVSLAVKNGRKW
jgi:hypothetical protein